MKKTLLCFITSVCILVSLCPPSIYAAPQNIPDVNTDTITLSSSTYYDKTLAGMLGQFAGFLTGYEFIWDSNGNPREPLPDSWFSILNGPYSGNFTHGGDSSYPGYNRYWDTSVIASDDDFHIDIFNQHILAEHGPNIISKKPGALQNDQRFSSAGNTHRSPHTHRQPTPSVVYTIPAESNPL